MQNGTNASNISELSNSLFLNQANLPQVFHYDHVYATSPSGIYTDDFTHLLPISQSWLEDHSAHPQTERVLDVLSTLSARQWESQ